MIQITCKGNSAICTRAARLTSGMVGLQCEFVFDGAWDGLARTAVFWAGNEKRDVLLQGAVCTVPWEVLKTAGYQLVIGVYGTNAEGTLVIPTVYAMCGGIASGADPSGDESTDPTLPVWAQIQGMIGNLEDLDTEAKNNLVAAINEAAQTGSGGANIALRVEGGYIQYTVDGITWSNLIAVADLKGAQGDTGKDGAPGKDGVAATIAVGTVSTGAAGSAAEVVNRGTSNAAVFDFKIPQGEPGKDGSPGKDGVDGITPTIGDNGNWYIGSTDTGKPSRGVAGATGAAGPAGKDGHTPVKGVDYWTAADKSEIVEDTAAAIDLTAYAKTADVPTKTSELTNDSGFVAASELAAELAGKQDIISDLATIRSGAAKGATALQSVPNSYRTAEAQDVIDAGKQDALIQSGASVGQIAKITAVDSNGKPTAWQAVDMPSGGSSGVQPDWNQNDDTQPDYVKNRPFYAGDHVETVLVEESTVSFSAHGGTYVGNFSSTLYPTIGETYKVSWDGTAYECTCVNMSNAPVIGNLSIAGAGSDTGEPFLMRFHDQSITIGTLDTSDSHTISISGYIKSVVKINAKYLPVASETEPGIVSITPLSEVILQHVKNEYFSERNTQVLGYEGAATIEEYADNNNSHRIYSSGKFGGAVLSCYNDTVNKYITFVLAGGENIECWKSSRGSTERLWGIFKDGVVISSSTPDSTKKFKITVDDSGTISATEVI